VKTAVEVGIGVLVRVGVKVGVRVKGIVGVSVTVGVLVNVFVEESAVGVEVAELVGVIVRTGVTVAEGTGVFPFGAIGKIEVFRLQDNSKKATDPARTSNHKSPRCRIINIPLNRYSTLIILV
jgi:hypothetical protein